MNQHAAIGRESPGLLDGNLPIIDRACAAVKASRGGIYAWACVRRVVEAV